MGGNTVPSGLAAPTMQEEDSPDEGDSEAGAGAGAAGKQGAGAGKGAGASTSRSGKSTTKSTSTSTSTGTGTGRASGSQPSSSQSSPSGPSASQKAQSRNTPVFPPPRTPADARLAGARAARLVVGSGPQRAALVAALEGVSHAPAARDRPMCLGCSSCRSRLRFCPATGAPYTRRTEAMFRAGQGWTLTVTAAQRAAMGAGAREAYVRHLWAADWLSAAARVPLREAGAVNAVAHEHGRRGALEGLAADGVLGKGVSGGLQKGAGAQGAGGGAGVAGNSGGTEDGQLRPSPLAVSLGPGAQQRAGARRPRGASDGMSAGVAPGLGGLPSVQERERVLSFSSDLQSADGDASVAARTAHSTDDERERERLFPPMDGAQGPISLDTSPLLGAAARNRAPHFAMPDLDLSRGLQPGAPLLQLSPRAAMLQAGSGGEEDGTLDSLALAGFSREGVGALGSSATAERRVEVDSSDSGDSGGSASSSTSSSDDGSGGSEEDDEGEEDELAARRERAREQGRESSRTSVGKGSKRQRRLRANGRKSPGQAPAPVGPQGSIWAKQAAAQPGRAAGPAGSGTGSEPSPFGRQDTLGDAKATSLSHHVGTALSNSMGELLRGEGAGEQGQDGAGAGAGGEVRTAVLSSRDSGGPEDEEGIGLSIDTGAGAKGGAAAGDPDGEDRPPRGSLSSEGASSLPRLDALRRAPSLEFDPLETGKAGGAPRGPLSLEMGPADGSQGGTEGG